MLNVLTKRFPPLHITIFPVRVQGEGAAEEIAGAVAEINLIQDVDVIIVGRGGGSIEDLWAFNEEVLARAIAASRTPVISAVGHETDLTISDLVADLRALTPTEAAERVVPDLADLLGSLESNGGRLRYSMESMISVLDARLHKHRDSHALKSPETIADQYLQRLRHLADGLTLRLQERHQGALAGIEALAQTLHFRLQGRFDQTASRLAELTAHMSLRPILSTFRNGDDRIHRLSPQLDTLARHRLDRSERELKQLSALLESFSPLQVLGRGYTITFNAASGKIVKDGSELKHGDLLKTRFHTGETISRVEKE
ncbi:MAG: exodeoxyribonuclease VII large subunit [Planctomycetes bacterium RBG_16_59_8]|nr:MAG: exodeoxyribonuclease VII large subunit [Planctomycetes bacterium RBG_16_59_8]